VRHHSFLVKPSGEHPRCVVIEPPVGHGDGHCDQAPNGRFHWRRTTVTERIAEAPVGVACNLGVVRPRARLKPAARNDGIHPHAMVKMI